MNEEYELVLQAPVKRKKTTLTSITKAARNAIFVSDYINFATESS